MTQDRAKLQAVYKAQSDDAIIEAQALGPESYSPEAWSVIQAELRDRALTPVPTLVVAQSPLPHPPPATHTPAAALPQPLALTLLTLAVVLLLMQLVLLLSYYQILQTTFLIWPNTALFAGLSAWSCTRFIRTGPYAPYASRIGWTALLVLVIAILARL